MNTNIIAQLFKPVFLADYLVNNNCQFLTDINIQINNNVKSLNEILRIEDYQEFVNELTYYLASKETEQGSAILNTEQNM